MGASKTEYFSAKQNQFAIMAKALGHPARIAIMEYLIKLDDCICDDIVGKLPLAQPTISQHLRELKKANLIIGSINKNSICYCINPHALSKFKKFIDLMSSSLDKKNSCC